jgi:hypothetical protein
MIYPWQRTRRRTTLRNHSATCRRQLPLGLEELEDRCLLSSVFTVTTAADNGDNANPTPGSLRQGMLLANTIIEFAIGTGSQTITPVTALPDVPNGSTIDGTTQPGFAGAPLITIAGSNAGLNVNGFHSTVQGIVISGANGAGITISGQFNQIQNDEIVLNKGDGIQLPGLFLGRRNVIIDNWIGTDPSTTQMLGNTGNGISISETGDTLGDIGHGNTIRFNTGAGILETQQGNVIRGNSIDNNAGGGIIETGSPTIPVVDSAASSSSGTTVIVDLQPAPTALGGTIDLYFSPAADPSGFGQGRTYLGTINSLTAIPNADAAISSATFATVVPAGEVVTATSSSLGFVFASATSQFSRAVPVQTSAPLPSMTALSLSRNPTGAGLPLLLMAQASAGVGAAGTPTGTITFLDGTSPLGTDSLVPGNPATLIFPSGLAIGPHNLTAVYSGDANFAGSTSNLATEVVNPSPPSGETPTTTALTATFNSMPTNSSFLGQGLTISAGVMPTMGTGTPSGPVAFLDGTTVLGSAALTNGSAGLTPSPTLLSLGMHTLTAVYGGDNTFADSVSSNVNETVNQVTSSTTPGAVATTTTISSSSPGNSFSASVQVGQPLTLTAHVSQVGGGVPGGAVEFFDTTSNKSLAVVPTDTSGIAQLVSPNAFGLASGIHQLTAIYGGLLNPGGVSFAGSTSMPLAQVVAGTTPSATTISLVSRNPLTATATVTPAMGAGSPTGTVTFVFIIQGGEDVAPQFIAGPTVPLDTHGMATADLSGTSLQPFEVVFAFYNGDATFSSSQSGSILLLKGGIYFVLTSAPNPSEAGLPVTFTATLYPQSLITPFRPSGDVTFVDGATVLGTVNTGSGNVATFTTSALAAGTHTITAVYGGNSDFTPGTSQAFTQTVNSSAVVALQSLYRDVLGRSADADGLSFWMQQMQSGKPFSDVVRGFWESPEHRGIQVDGYYQRILGRAAEPSGRAFWVNAFLSGVNEIQVQLGFVTSAEFVAAHGTPATYVTALYALGLNRAPEPAGLAFWENVATNAGIAQAALGIFTSKEGYTRVVDGFYVEFLKRGADPLGELFWLTGLENFTLSATGVAEGILGSPEYHALATGIAS